MKLFQVVTERDGATIKAPGVSETEIIRDTMFFAADSMKAVWNHIAWIHEDQERELVSVSEVAPSVTVIATTRSESYSYDNP